jgi:iron complex outermembrane receptor protein
VEKATTASIINVVLSEEGGQALQEIVVTGSRTPVSNTKSPLPIDVVSAKDLVSTGQTTFDKALQYRIPSFSSTNSGK